MDAIDRLFQYLWTTKERALFAPYTATIKIESSSDSDWCADKHKRRALTGCHITINGMPIIMYARYMKCIALSVCDSELYAFSQAARMIKWLRSFLLDLRLIDEKYVFELLCDNGSALAIVKSKNGMSPQRHIDIRIKWIQDCISEKWLSPAKVPGIKNASDGYTKILCKDKQATFLDNGYVNTSTFNCE